MVIRYRADMEKIFLNDRQSLTLLLLSLVFMCTLLFPFALVTVIWLALRVVTISQIIETGVVTQGRLIYRGNPFTRKVPLEYEYQVQGQVYRATNRVVAFKLPYRNGDIIPVIYDPDAPSRAYLPELYGTRIA